MKTKITLFLFFTFTINYFFAQEYCGTPNTAVNHNFSSLSRMLNDIATNEETLCLNVYFHIVRDDNGLNGLPQFELGNVFVDLNNKYNPHKISFNNLGYDTINNTLLNDVQNSETATIFTINNVANAINIYIVKSASDWNGFAESIPSRNLIVTADAAINGITAHEVGHCLNLWHTHETKFGVEIQDDCSVNGDNTTCNCTFAGDLLCDTPPDPKLRVNDEYFVNSSCIYTGGNGYNPDTRNIMSYSLPSCLQHFTNGQALRMRDAILNEPILQSVLNCSCSVATFYGKTTICSTETATYAFPCSSVSFVTSTNLQTISATSSPDGSSITVKPISSSINGKAFVKINGTSNQKDIWVGKPKADVQLTPDGNMVLLDLIGVSSNINDQNITHIEWETISSTGSGYMSHVIDRFQNLARGNDANWSINAKITVANGCDSTYIYKTIAPPEPLPCESGYYIAKTDKNEYITYSIIDPCNTAASYKNTAVMVPDSDIKEATLYDIYGLKVKTYNKNLFDINYLKSGIYIFKVKVKDNIVTQKIIIE